MSDDLPTDVAQLQADLRADRETIRLLATELMKRERSFNVVQLRYLMQRGTFRPAEFLREAMRTYRKSRLDRAARLPGLLGGEDGGGMRWWTR